MSSASLQTNKIIKPSLIPTSSVITSHTLQCLSKRRIYSFFKIILIIFVFCLYFIILLKASLATMEEIKYKMPDKLDRSNNIINLNYMNRNNKYNSRKSSYHTNINSNNKKLNITQIAIQNVTQHITVNPIYEYSEEMNTAAENEFSKRRHVLWDTCLKRKITGKYPPNAWEFFISPGHGITWCNVFKAASSTWLYYFNILGGYTTKQLQYTHKAPVQLARHLFPRPNTKELSEALTNSLSFLVVREPFERLVSAYKNKLEGDRHNFYSHLGKQIVNKFRKISYYDKRNLRGPTFREFLLYLVDLNKHRGHFDEHWSPVHKFCTPCSINFTLVAKLETFQRDTEYIIRQAGLETLLLNKLPQHKIDKIRNRSSNNDTKSLVPLYFSQIDENLLRDVLEIYELDFELFGYNSTKYFDYVHLAPSPTPPPSSSSTFSPEILPTRISNCTRL